MKYNYRIGLDVGIESVGWAAIEHDNEENPCRIIDLGVRCFDAAEVPNEGKSLAQPRREARGARRRLRRRAHRIERVKSLLLRYSFLSEEELDKLYDKESFLPNASYPQGFSVYRARYLALEQKISNADLARVLLSIAKRRGFKSNRKSETKKDKDGKKMLSAVQENQALRIEKGYRTVGEMLYKDDAFREQYYNSSNQSFDKRLKVRNANEEYSKTILLDEHVEEIKTIFKCQREFGNILPEAFCQEYLDILTSRRAFDEGPAEPSKYRGSFKVGDCTFEKDEKRASKGCYSFEYFRAMQNVVNIRLSQSLGKRGTPLSDEQRKTLIAKIKSLKICKYQQARKELNLPDEIKFSNLNYNIYDRAKQCYKNPEEKEISNFKNSWEIKKVIKGASIEELDEVANILGLNKSDDRIEKALSESTIIRPLSKEQIEQLQGISFNKYAHLSLKALRKISKVMEERGLTYDKACQEVGYDFKAHPQDGRTEFLNTKEIYEQVKNIANPVVRRSISQTLKVLNAIIREYGSPQAIIIELSREMAKNYKERQALQKMQLENYAENENIRKEVQEIKSNAVGIDFLKYRLFKEQGGLCPYSGAKLDPSRIFEIGYAEIDHIIPFSRSNNDSYLNKVLVLKKENQAKKNMTPYEYFTSIGRDFSKLEAFFADNRINNRKKRSYLLIKKFTQKDAMEMQERTLTDTKYAARLLKNLIQDFLIFKQSKTFSASPVITVNGSVTAFLRKRWGLNKIREEGDLHHAQDAAVIACTTRSMIKRVTVFFQRLEDPYAREYVDYETGEIISRDEYFERYSQDFPRPYANFKKELEIRLFNDPLQECYINELIKMGYDQDDLKDVHKVFVSRMANYKKRGQMYDSTIYSAKFQDTDGYVVRKSIKELKFKNGEIENYFRPESDTITYNILKERLKEFGGNAKEAFAEPIYKTKKDGSRGNPILRVKVTEKGNQHLLKDSNKSSVGKATQLRIDFFKKKGKYYMVPVYVYDYYKNNLPNKAIKAKTPSSNWIEMDESFEFCFSLYPYELIYVHKDAGFSMKSVGDELLKKKDKSIEVRSRNLKSEYLYFAGINSANNSSKVFSHDKSFVDEVSFRGFNTIKKCRINFLGRVKVIETNEKRKQLR